MRLLSHNIQEILEMDSLVRSLPDGPIDIIGDVHGELDAMCSLLGQLDYGAGAEHPESRTLVFLGDLTDRGPHSPTVVRLVQRWIDTGRAYCVLGNHDLNLMLGEKKFDNGWFFNDVDLRRGPEATVDSTTKDEILRFFATLPLALERDDLHIVHACWDAGMIEHARAAEDALELYQEFHNLIAEDTGSLDEIAQGLAFQNRNPVKVLTSGKERRIENPFEASGKLRFEERVLWWEDYTESTTCVFGHYSGFGGSMSPSNSALCIDYGVGKRAVERLSPDFSGLYKNRLAAFRYPERRVIFDDGVEHQL